MAVAAVVTSSPAAAHGGLDNYVAKVTSVEPALPGLRVTIVGGDDQVLLTNDSGRPVSVPGYEGEPYLRFEAGRVLANRRSPAYYLGAQRAGAVVPPEADAAAPPEWAEVATGSTFAWHDQRVLWSEARRPPGVEANPGTRQVIRQWSIVLDAGQPVTVRGTLEWVPSADGSIWLGVGLVLLVTGGVAGRRLTRDIEEACATLGLATAGPALMGFAVAANGMLSGFAPLRDSATVLFAALAVLLGVRARAAPSAAAAAVTALALLALGAVGGLARLAVLDDPINGPEDQILPLAVVMLAGLSVLLAALLSVAAARRMRAGGYSTATM